MIKDLSTSGDSAAADDPLGRHLVFVAKLLREAFEEVLRRSDASLGTWIVLRSLTQAGPLSQTVLAHHAHLEGATMTHHIDRLEQLGLVRRRVDPDDRRVRRVEATEAGKALHDRLLVEALEFQRTLLAGLSDADQAELRRLLDRVAANLQERRAAAEADD